MRPTTTCTHIRGVLIEAIKAHMQTHKLTQKHVAEMTGLTQQRVSLLLLGREGFSLDTLINVASILGFNMTIQLRHKTTKL